MEREWLRLKSVIPHRASQTKVCATWRLKMFSKHVSSLTSAYCHDELSPAESRRVAEHLISCQRCRGEFEEIKFGARLAAQLPLIEAPDSLWRGIEIALDRDGRPALTRHRPGIIPFLMQPRFA